MLVRDFIGILSAEGRKQQCIIHFKRYCFYHILLMETVFYPTLYHKPTHNFDFLYLNFPSRHFAQHYDIFNREREKEIEKELEKEIERN